ncbi:hypothetical protein OK016_00815 [Vibrio chagasii]|nr:hypothetical protein [Vibrio chagasii]
MMKTMDPQRFIANTRGRDGVIEGNADLRGDIVINTKTSVMWRTVNSDSQSVKGKSLISNGLEKTSPSKTTL